MASQEADLKKRQMQRADDQKKADKARVETRSSEQACADARSQHQDLRIRSAHARVNEKGEPVYLTTAMKRQERERLECATMRRAPPRADRAIRASPA